MTSSDPIRIMNIKTSLLSALSLATFLVLSGGCAVGPNYKKPALTTPATFRFTTGTSTNSFADLPWWQVFKDPTLHDLIYAALTNNYDLKQAVARVEQARNQATAARAPFFPQIGYGGNVGRGKNALFNSAAPLGGATESSASLTLGAAWEIDIWGRIRRLSEAARAQYLATEEARRGVTISLVSEVATTYFQLLQLDQELEIQREATNSFGESYRIFDQRRINGVASKLETDRAAAAQANAAALIPQLELNIALTENQLNVLLGRNPGPIGRTNTLAWVQLQPEIPAGLPGDLLRRRPDILAREQSLIAANANIGASFANFFPQIGLTTFFGKVSPELSAFSSGSANAWNVGATLAGPLFQGGQLRAQYQGAKARFDEAKAAYEQSVLTGFQEVSNALIARQQFTEQSGFNAQAVEALKSSVDLAMQRYQTGKSSYFEVLQAQQELYPTQRAQVQTQANALIAVVQLYRALGGGWTPDKITDLP
jgi:outer membrane protein, multidrug efflux system